MATLLPNAVQQFVDQNGNPLAGGSVFFYIPSTTTPKTTWSNSGGTIQNPNPIVLNAAGENPAGGIFGSGSYRQVVYDAAGNLIWDQLTADTAVGGLAWGGTSTGTGNAQVISASSFSQQDGQQIAFIAGFANTGAMTVTPGTGSPIPVLKDSTTGPTPLTGGEVGAGNAVNLIYDASRGAFHIENTSINGSAPASNADALAATSTGEYLTPSNLSLERTLFGLGVPMINGALASSVSGNAVTFSLLGLDGNAPSSADPVYVAFRNSSATSGNYVVRTITSTTALTLNSGVTLGTANATPFRVWIVAVDTGSGIQLGAVNTLSGTSIMALEDNTFYSTSTPGDSAQVIYTTSGLSSAPIRLLGYFDWTSGLVTAGTWASDATFKQLFGPGVPRPRSLIQTARTDTGTGATGTNVIPGDNTIPQVTEGTQFMTRSITPTSAINMLHVSMLGIVAPSTGANIVYAGFRDSTANAIAAALQSASTNAPISALLDFAVQAGSTSSTTFSYRVGGAVSSTITFNGLGGSQLLGGAMNSFLQVDEIMV